MRVLAPPSLSRWARLTLVFVQVSVPRVSQSGLPQALYPAACLRRCLSQALLGNLCTGRYAEAMRARLVEHVANGLSSIIRHAHLL